MNERIRELADEAGLRFTQLMSNPMVPVVDGRETDLEKFAELIVAECVAQCEQVAADADVMADSKYVTDMGRQLHEGMWGGAKNCTAQIREHFGLEL